MDKKYPLPKETEQLVMRARILSYFAQAFIALLLLWLGGWVFNHTPWPFAGIVIAAAYPLFLVVDFFNNKGDKS